MNQTASISALRASESVSATSHTVSQSIESAMVSSINNAGTSIMHDDTSIESVTKPECYQKDAIKEKTLIALDADNQKACTFFEVGIPKRIAINRPNDHAPSCALPEQTQGEMPSTTSSLVVGSGSGSSQAQILDSFHGFPNLPPELRRKIWKEALPAPQILYHEVDVLNGNLVRSSLKPLYPDVLRNPNSIDFVKNFMLICYEATEIFLEEYAPVKLHGASIANLWDMEENNALSDIGNLPEVIAEHSYFNDNRDIICLDGSLRDDGYRGDLATHNAWLDTSRIKNLALEIPGDVLKHFFHNIHEQWDEYLNQTFDIISHLSNLKSLTMVINVPQDHDNRNPADRFTLVDIDHKLTMFDLDREGCAPYTSSRNGGAQQRISALVEEAALRRGAFFREFREKNSGADPKFEVKFAMWGIVWHWTPAAKLVNCSNDENCGLHGRYFDNAWLCYRDRYALNYGDHAFRSAARVRVEEIADDEDDLDLMLTEGGHLMGYEDYYDGVQSLFEE